MRHVGHNPWFQSFASIAATAMIIGIYNQVAQQAYWQPGALDRDLATGPPRQMEPAEMTLPEPVREAQPRDTAGPPLAKTLEPAGAAGVRTPPQDMPPPPPAARPPAQAQQPVLSVTGAGGVNIAALPVMREIVETRPTSVITATPGTVQVLAYSNTGQLLACSGKDGAVTLWSSDDGMQVGTIPIGYAVSAMVFQPQDDLLVVGGSGGQVKAWQLESRAVSREYAGPTTSIGGLAYSPDRSRLAAGAADGSIWIWEMSAGTLIRKIPGGVAPGHFGSITAVAFLADPDKLVTASADEYVKFWSVASGSELRSISLGAPAVRLAVSPDGTRVAASRRRPGGLVFIDVAGMAEKFRVDARQSSLTAMVAVGTVALATAGSDFLKFWDASNGNLLQSIPIQGRVAAVAASPEAGQLAIAGDDGRVSIWKIRSARQ